MKAAYLSQVAEFSRLRLPDASQLRGELENNEAPLDLIKFHVTKLFRMWRSKMFSPGGFAKNGAGGG
jgi:hypothetical protein